MLFRRIWSFITHLFFWMPLSFIINMLVLAPVISGFQMLSENSMDFFGLLLTIIIMYAIAFFIAKWRMRIKGKNTDAYYDVAYDEVNVNVTEFSDYFLIEETHYEGVRTESTNTVWGWIGIALSFIAFPLQLIALIMSFLGIFIPNIYSTARALPENQDFSVFNKITHTLFDFVIIPFNMEQANPSSILGIFWIPLFIVLPVLNSGLLAVVTYFIKEKCLHFDIGTQAYSLILIPLLALLLFSLVISILKYSVLIIWSCSAEEAGAYIKKLLLLSVVIGLVLAGIVILL